MAVYTDINETELAAFLEGYEIGHLLSYKGIAEGTENSNFLIHTTADTYLLTLYERRVERDDLPFFLGLMEHLARKGVSCPLPVHRRDGEVIGTLAGRPAAIVTFLEGMWPRRPTAMHCREVGAALAKLHVAGTDFAIPRANALGPDGWHRLWADSRVRADEVEPGLASEVEADFAVLDANWPETLPSGVIHADLFPDNVFFLGDSHLPQCLVLREGWLVQPHQGRGSPCGISIHPFAVASRDRCPAAPGARLGAALHADTPL